MKRKDEKQGQYFIFPVAFKKLLSVISKKCNMTMTDLVQYAVINYVKQGKELNLFRGYALSQEQRAMMQLFDATQQHKVEQALSLDNFEKQIHTMMLKDAVKSEVKEYCVLEIVKINLAYSKEVRKEYQDRAKAIIKKYFPHLLRHVMDESKQRIKRHETDLKVTDGELINNYQTAEDYLQMFLKNRGGGFLE